VFGYDDAALGLFDVVVLGGKVWEGEQAGFGGAYGGEESLHGAR